jgi:pimeloyl-ACP methyl ester carboxylesterase
MGMPGVTPHWAAAATCSSDRSVRGRKHWCGRTLFLLATLTGLVALPAPAQDRVSEIRSEYADLLRYLGVLDHAPPATIDRLAALNVTIWESDAPTEQRHQAVQEYVEILWPMLELDESYRMVRDITAVASQYNSIIDAYGEATRPDLTQRRRAPAREDWRLHVAEEGTGPVPVLLIGDIGVDAGQMYAGFMKRNRDRYRMFAVTFPGLGGAEPQPHPERRDYAARTWLSRFEEAVATYLSDRGLEEVVVVGTAAGGYVAARLALDHPGRLRAAVLAGALLHTSARSPSDPNRPRSLAERLEDANRTLPFELSPLPRPPADPGEIAAILRDPNRSYPGLLNFFSGTVRDAERTIAWSTRLASTDGGTAAAYEYYFELYTTDLRDELAGLEVPTLVMVPGYAGTAPSARAVVLSQWEEMTLQYPDALLQVAVFEDQPSYIATESPALFSAALEDFLAARPVPGHSVPVPAVLPTPRAAAMQTIDSLEVTVRYRRPSVGERDLWGSTVPYGRVWNPGSGETTTITFSANATVGGQPLRAGTYALLMIPAEQDWTVVFNSIPDQWQNTTYNPAFDALRVTVHPETAVHQEQLVYMFEQLQEHELTLVLRWERTQIAIPIRASSR